MSESVPGGGDPVRRLREICLALPGAVERASHGEPAFFAGAKPDGSGGRQFVMLDDHHHGAPRLAFWCAAPPSAQEALIAEDPGRYFRPPYVGHRGWVGVRIDEVDGHGPDWSKIAGVVRDAYLAVAPKRAAGPVEPLA